MSNAVMDTHSTIFVTIGNLVSPSGSVNGDPLFDFPVHWQPRFSARFPLCWEVKERTGPPPSKGKICPFSPGQAAPSSRGVCCLARATYETRCLLIGRSSIRRVTTGLGGPGPRFRWPRDRFVAQLFFGYNPILDIFSVFAAALKIQLMSSASDLFSRWFFASKHGNILGCVNTGPERRSPYMRCGLLAVS